MTTAIDIFDRFDQRTETSEDKPMSSLLNKRKREEEQWNENQQFTPLWFSNQTPSYPLQTSIPPPFPFSSHSLFDAYNITPNTWGLPLSRDHQARYQSTLPPYETESNNTSSHPSWYGNMLNTSNVYTSDAKPPSLPQPARYLPNNPPPTPSNLKRTESDLERVCSSLLVQPVVVFRNLFHQATCTISNFDKTAYEGYRVYVDENVGYPGNATRFKRTPDPEEKAFVLSIHVTDPNGNSVTQCKPCKEYYTHQGYFKASPSALGRVLLVKNNAPIRIENDSFKVQFKVMCACSHHGVDYFNYHFTVTMINGGVRTEYTTTCPVFAKQWRKSKQTKEDLNLNLFPAGHNGQGQSQDGLTFGQVDHSRANLPENSG
ncbi:transcription factor [Planoprotostelium fungivorum]|uniref:Transcription factor n=1 Tax=Planoprotostelium fungivorum TaxID=1890364 RepID=A0A2P6NPE7_9EUKA|nr:transcription factor [Planoprotostelium fungivorum]